MSKIQMYVNKYVLCLKEQRRCQIGSIIVVILVGILGALSGCKRPVFYKNDTSSPIANKEVRILCYDTQSLEPMLDNSLDGTTRDSNVYTVMTNSNGRFVEAKDDAGNQSRKWPDNCKYVLALNEEYTYETGTAKPEHGPVYIVYSTNWTPGNEKPQDIGDPIVISDDENHRLVLFNVVASIAWQANQTYVNELEEGLSKASGLLYDLTDGQMAFARPSIYLNGNHWNDADIRVLAANDYRPTAYVGGMVRETTPFWANGLGIKARHHPGAIFLGRYWDASDAANGSWSAQEGYSTIVHEWGHYALFLHDEYLDKDHKPASCLCPYAPFEEGKNGKSCDLTSLISDSLVFSPMYYQYALDKGTAATEFWHTTNEDSVSCNETVQAFVHGQSDWDTLGRWYEIQGVTGYLPFEAAGLKVPATNPQEGPGRNQAVIDLAEFFVIHDAVSETLPKPDQTNLQIMNAPGIAIPATVTDTFPAQVYIKEDGTPPRILYQGLYPIDSQAENIGQENIVGVQNSTDHLAIFVDKYKTNDSEGARWMYTAPVGTTAGAGDTPVPVELTADSWQPSLDITYQVSGTLLTTMIVTVTATESITPTAQLCVMDSEIGCASYWHKPMTLVENQPGVWQATIGAREGNELPRYSIIHVHAEGAGELIRWIQIAGVGPIHGDTDSPTRDGSIVVDTLENIPHDSEKELQECYRAIVMPAANYGLLQSGLLPESGGKIVGVPLEVDMVMTDIGKDGYPCRQFGANEELPVQVVYTLFYNAIQLNASSLRVFHVSPGDTPGTEAVWTDISPTDVTGLSLRYGAFGGNLNLDINGESRNFNSFAAINGETIGDVKVTVTEYNDIVGVLELTGPVNTLMLSGQELFIDDVCPTLMPSDNKNPQASCLDFEDIEPGTSFTNTVIPTTIPITVTPIDDGNGTATIVEGEMNEETIPYLSGQILQANNVNLSFDLSQYRSEQTTAGQGQSGQIAWISTAPIQHSGIFVLVGQ